jgi:hypothetical protein
VALKSGKICGTSHGVINRIPKGFYGEGFWNYRIEGLLFKEPGRPGDPDDRRGGSVRASNVLGHTTPVKAPHDNIRDHQIVGLPVKHRNPLMATRRRFYAVPKPDQYLFEDVGHHPFIVNHQDIQHGSPHEDLGKDSLFLSHLDPYVN